MDMDIDMDSGEPMEVDFDGEPMDEESDEGPDNGEVCILT